MREHFRFSATITLCMFLVAGPLLAMAPGPKSAKNISPIIERGRSESSARKSKRPPAPIVRPIIQAPVLADGQTATLMPDGRWLIVGGEGPHGPRAEAGLKDPNSDAVTPIAGKLSHARKGHSASLVPDGNVPIFGGVAADGRVVDKAELFNPATQRFELLTSINLAPRNHHTATLLTDGRVLFAGGVSARGRLLDKVETWDSQTNTVVALQARLQTARQKQTATLLPSGGVLLWGGEGQGGLKLEGGEIFDPETQSFSWVNGFVDQDEKEAPRLEASIPNDGTTDAPLETRIALRFSQPLRVETVNDSTVTLAGPAGTVPAKVVPAEGGLLAFVTPLRPLESDTSYTLTLNGSANRKNLSLPFTVVSFKTVHTHTEETPSRPADGGQASGNNGGRPAAQNNAPNSVNTDAPAKSATPLQAAPGVTALAGQVLTVSGQPLANVTLQVGDKTAVTDQAGRFLLTSLPSGTHGLTILGETASSPGKTYGTFDVKVDIAAGRTTTLPYTIWLPLLDNQYAVRLSVPTSRETVVTTPRMPGMEVRVPAGAVLRMPQGMHHMKGAMHMSPMLDSLAITPIPTGRTPFPLPQGIQQAVVFTLQLHGAKVEGPNGEKRPGLRIIFPNSLGLPAGSRVEFWNYESNGAGWYLYGLGTVTPDGRQVMPDPGVELQSMHCLSFMSPLSEMVGQGPTPGSGSKDGDPVDLSTGLFLFERTDLVLPDVIPIVLSRTHRQQDTRARSFGIGMTHPYEMFIVGDSYNFGELILPDGGRIRYNHDPARTDGVWAEHTATPSAFYKSTLTYNTTREPAGWDIKFRDGTIYRFNVVIGRFGFPGSAYLGSIEDPYGNKLTITANKIISPNGRWVEFTRNANNYITQAKDNTGRTVNYEYDANYRLWKVTDANQGVMEYTYDAAGRIQSIKDARSVVYLTNEYDSNGRVFKQTQADQSVYQFAYTLDAAGKIVQTDVTDPRLNVRRVTFNANGYSLTDTFALGKPEQQVFTYERQAGTNRILSVIDPLLRQTTYTYDAAGNVSSVTSLAGTSDAVTTSITYEPRFNQVATVTDPFNHTTTYAYNGRGKVSSITNALGHKATFGYNPVAQLTSVSDPLGNTTRFNYNAGAVVEIIDPLGRSNKREMDGAGRATKATNPLGAFTTIEYNNLNQPTLGKDPLQGQTAFSYDPNGNLLSVTDARQSVTSYTYNNMDRVKTRRDPLLHDEIYEYDENGNLKQVTDRKGQITNYTYDALDRLKQVTFADTSTINYTYDAGNRVTQVVDSQSGTITYGYDNLNRLTSETTAQGVVSYTYDAAGRRSTMTVAGQPTVNYTYDEANRLTQITQGSATVIIGYDNAGRRTSLTLPNGMVTVYGYDAASQLTSLTYKRNSTVLGNLTYEYDQAGRRTKIGGSYARSLAPQSLASATYNAANQQTDFGGQTLSYDLNGNLTGDGTNTYTWNARNQLVSISGGVNASFQYDASGRRISKTVNGVTTGYLHDGRNVVQELSGSAPTVNLLTGGLDEVFNRTDPAGARSAFIDGLGSTLALGDASGTIQSEYAYDAFGKSGASGSTTGNASQYTGRENDGTGLYYYRNRYYSPALQRFISQDPIGFGGGINLYAYVGNDPLNWKDPLGLDKSNPLLDGLQFLLDLGGMIPIIGEPLDLLNGGISYLRGDTTGAVLSLGSAIPFLGNVSGGTKIVRRIGKYLDDVPEVGQKVFRVWGDESGAWGKSWTRTDPSTVANYRDVAGLPNQNSGRFVSEGILTDTTGVKARSALELHGNKGGLDELLIPNPQDQIRLTGVGGVNPPF